MKPLKNVINPDDLPQRFGWSFWVIIYLILDKIESNNLGWWSLAICFVLWTLLFFYIKSFERKFSVAEFKKNIDKWISK